MKVFPTQTATTTEKRLLIGGYKTLLIQRSEGGMDLTFYVAFSYRLAESRETDWYSVDLSEKFVAPKGKRFYVLFYKMLSNALDFRVSATNGDARCIPERYYATVIDSSAARTTSGGGNNIFVGLRHKIWILVNVTAVSGTNPTLDIKVQTASALIDSTRYADLYEVNSQNGATEQIIFPQITAIGTYAIQFDCYAPFIRLYWTIGGTSPSFTFATESHAKEPLTI